MPLSSLDLTGSWEFKEYPAHARRMRDIDQSPWFNATVPGSIYQNLAESGTITIGDIARNAQSLDGIAATPWIYSKTFCVNQELLACDRIDLIFEGLDTIAAIWVNEKLIGKTANMFRTFRFDVTEYVRHGENRLLVKFEPPVEHASKLMERYGNQDSLFRNPFRAYIRKAHYQFGWDFCPSLPGCGIWRPCGIEGIQRGRIRDIQVSTIEANSHYADIRIAVKIETLAPSACICRLCLFAGSLNVIHELIFEQGQDFQSAVIRIERPFLWWPRGYGLQYLYQFKADLMIDRALVDSRDMRIGVRTIRCVTASDNNGPNFQFEVNGQSIYVKGAHWMPISMMPGSERRADYDLLLETAVSANINMLRVWGGGVYESSDFYAACDKLGILVWQDFMFAHACYPDRQWFIDEVQAETRDVVSRLRNYACLAVWCGNSGIEADHAAGKLCKSRKLPGRELFHNLIPTMLAELDPARHYIASVPEVTPGGSSTRLARIDAIGEGHMPLRHCRMPFSKIPRFASGFGLASLPAIQTCNDVLTAEQARIGSQSVERLNYKLDCNSSIYRYTADLFGGATSLADLVYKSQITQARAAALFVEHLRAHNIRNNGVLLWKFNDSCTSTSHGMIDHAGHRRAIYYYARRFFAPLLITAVPEYEQHNDDEPGRLCGINVVVVNDTAHPLTARMLIELMDLGGVCLDHTSFPAAVSPLSTSVPFKLPKAFVFVPEPCRVFLRLTITAQRGILAENTFFFVPDKYIIWPKPQFSLDIIKDDSKGLRIRVGANVFARDVFIQSAQDACLHDNFFDLSPRQYREIIMTTGQPDAITADTLSIISQTTLAQ